MALYDWFVCCWLQGMVLLMPGMFIIGRASSITLLYIGLVLFSFGKS